MLSKGFPGKIARIFMGRKGLKGISEKTAKTMSQLKKELWIPVSLATIWTIYDLFINGFTVSGLFKTFIPTLFMLSWFTGQFFRVRKQAGVETSLATVESRIQGVTERLEKQTKELIGYVTGGDSFVYFRLVIRADNSSTWLATHGGDSVFPAYRVNASIVDLDIFDATVGLGRAHEATTSVAIGDLLPHTFSIEREHDLGDGQSRNFNVFFTAGNGHIQQRIRLRRVNDEWKLATRVNNDNGFVHTYVDEDYPRDASGEVCWE